MIHFLKIICFLLIKSFYYWPNQQTMSVFSCCLRWHICHSRAEKAHLYLCCVFSAFSVCLIPLSLAMITGFAASSLYLWCSLCRAFALRALICLLMGAGWPVALAVGSEPSLTGLTCQQPLCALGGFEQQQLAPWVISVQITGESSPGCTGICRLISIVSNSVVYFEKGENKKWVSKHTYTLFTMCYSYSSLVLCMFKCSAPT